MSKFLKYDKYYIMNEMGDFEDKLKNKLFNRGKSLLKNNDEAILVDYKQYCYFENLTDDCFFNNYEVSDKILLYYKKIIKSGIGNIILGGVDVGVKNKTHTLIHTNNKFLTKYKEIAFFAHSRNVKVYLKIKASLGRFLNLNENMKFKLGSNFCLDPENKQKLIMRISDNKCNEIINNISELSLVSSICKFDGIVIDATYKSIIGELSSNEFNKRIFGYYSSSKDFLTKLLKSIDTTSKLIVLKITVSSLFEEKTRVNNYNLNQPWLNHFFEQMKDYIDLGVDSFEFEFGRFENSFLHCFNGFEDELFYIDFVKSFRNYLINKNVKTKKGNDVSIFYHDNIISFSKVVDLINNNIVQFIDLTRNLYADELYFNKLKNAKNIKNCLKCSYCDKISKENKKVECLINPRLNDYDLHFINKEPHKVAVIGSGISGLICAITLIERGFNVFLYEQSSTLNKNGIASTIYGFDKSLSKYYEYINKIILKLTKSNKLTLFLNTKFTATHENLNKYQTIVLATGFKTKLLAVSGAVQSHVKSIYEILENKNYLNKRNNITIYANSELGLKLALFLSLNKKSISVVIKDIDLLNKQKNPNTYYYFYMLYECGAKIYFHSKIININEDNIDILINKNLTENSFKTMIDVFSNSKIKYDQKLINIDCDFLIYEPICVPNNSLYAEIVNKNYMGEIYLIGNALENSDLAGLIKSGYFVAKNI